MSDILVNILIFILGGACGVILFAIVRGSYE